MSKRKTQARPAVNDARLSRRQLRRRFSERVSKLGLPKFSHETRYKGDLGRARQRNTTPDALAHLASSPDEAVRMAALAHPRASEKVLLQALGSPEYGPRDAVLQIASIHPSATVATTDLVARSGDERLAELATETLLVQRLRKTRDRLDLFAALALAGGIVTAIVAPFAESVPAGQAAFYALAASCLLYWAEQGVGRGPGEWRGFAFKSVLLVPLAGVLLWLGLTPRYGIPVLDGLNSVVSIIVYAF